MLVSLQFKNRFATHIALCSIALPKATRLRSNENSISTSLIERAIFVLLPEYQWNESFHPRWELRGTASARQDQGQEE
jgi:hypothetical protein